MSKNEICFYFKYIVYLQGVDKSKMIVVSVFPVVEQPDKCILAQIVLQVFYTYLFVLVYSIVIYLLVYVARFTHFKCINLFWQIYPIYIHIYAIAHIIDIEHACPYRIENSQNVLLSNYLHRYKPCTFYVTVCTIHTNHFQHIHVSQTDPLSKHVHIVHVICINSKAEVICFSQDYTCKYWDIFAFNLVNHEIPIHRSLL